MTSLTYLTLMTNEEINHLIELAASAYCRRADFDGRRPVINDSDIVQFGGQFLLIFQYLIPFLGP